MSLSYFNVKKLRRQSKQPESSEATAPPAPTVSTPSEEPAASPVLDAEDEKFLQRLAAIAQEPEGTPPPLPNRPVTIAEGSEQKTYKNAEEALSGADQVPLPMSPPEVTAEPTGKGKEKADGGLGRTKSVMSYFSKFKKTGDKEQKKDKITGKDKAKAADDLHAAAKASKASDEKETKKEEEDLTKILDDLNLSAVNNRVFSFSKESEELLEKFKLVLKDVVNGVPTAYNDMEKLLTGSEEQLKKMYGTLPPFLQNLIKSLPTKITAALGPELLAAQAEKPGFDAKAKAAGSAGAKTLKPKIPSLKQLISAQGAVATMLKSILNFLKLRFPMVMTGTNVLLSLAVFILLFVFWYCHKRGREVRLEKEGLAAKEGASGADSSASSFTDGGDSVFDVKEKSGGQSSSEKPEPPLIIKDHNEESEQLGGAVRDLPSVAHLPEPQTVPLPDTEANTPLKEETLKVPESK